MAAVRALSRIFPAYGLLHQIMLVRHSSRLAVLNIGQRSGSLLSNLRQHGGAPPPAVPRSARTLGDVMIKKLLTLMAATVLAMSAPLSASAAPAPERTYSSLAAKWWTWAASQPVPTNPVADKTGKDCANGQTGSIWFLAGAVGGGDVSRTCTLPAGSDIFFPLINIVDIEAKADNRSPGFVRNVLASVDVKNSTSNLTVTFDGKDIGPEVIRYEESPMFAVTLPKQNIFGAPAGSYDPCGDNGYYALINGATPGVHTLNFTGAYDGPLGSFAINATYRLTVTG